MQPAGASAPHGASEAHVQGQADVIIVGIDIGGTFTDLMAFDESSNSFFQAKSLTTPKNLIQGIIDCINKCDLPVARIDQMIHGSTTAINTLIERKGARTALIVTRGTRDVYAIGRGNRPESYSIFFHRARPLVPRHLIFEVDERMIASGEVYKPLDLSQVKAARRTDRAGRRLARRRQDRGGGGLLPALLRQSRTRAEDRRGAASHAERALHLAVARDPARVPRIRAHLDHGGERLYRPDRRHLCGQSRIQPEDRSASPATCRSCGRTAASWRRASRSSARSR